MWKISRFYMSYPASYFFDLSKFAHPTLFEGDPEPWIAIQRISEYLKSFLFENFLGQISPQAYLIHPELISLGEGTIVEPGAYIQGPCVIGKNCIIRHGAYIRGNVIIGDDCVIGHDSEIKNSIFLNGAHAGHFNYVGDSILGNGVNLGAGVKCANFKLNHSDVKVRPGLESFSTGMKKLGACIGDGSQIGCNTVTNPGTLIGKEVWSYPCLNIRGFIPSRSQVKSPVKPVITPRFDF